MSQFQHVFCLQPSTFNLKTEQNTRFTTLSDSVVSQLSRSDHQHTRVSRPGGAVTTTETMLTTGTLAVWSFKAGLFECVDDDSCPHHHALSRPTHYVVFRAVIMPPATQSQVSRSLTVTCVAVRLTCAWLGIQGGPPKFTSNDRNMNRCVW